MNLGILHGRQAMMEPVAVNVGNPHTIFFVDDVMQVDVEKLGPEVENHVLFPQRTNVEFAQILSPEKFVYVCGNAVRVSHRLAALVLVLPSSPLPVAA